MKTILVILGILAGSFYPLADQQNFHQTKTINLIEDMEFGKNTTWRQIFNKPYGEITIAADGSIFVVNNRKHNISKFDPQGNLLRTFAQKGEGPGDLYSPDAPTILDNKYLIVGEYALRQRISVFDLQGNFVKLIKPGKSVFSTLALNQNKIAYMSFSFKEGNAPNPIQTTKVIIRDFKTGKEFVVKKRVIKKTSSLRVGKNGSISFSNIQGGLFISRDAKGNLIIGLSSEPFLEIYTPNGKKIRTVNLKIKATLATSEYIQKYKDIIVKQYSKRGKRAENWLKAIKKADFSKLFQEKLPYFEDIMIDGDGNILVFNYPVLGSDKILIDIHNPEGIFLKKIHLKTGKYKMEIDSRFKRLAFSTGLVYAYVGSEDEEGDIDFKIAKFHPREEKKQK